MSRSDIPITCSKELSKEVGRKRERGEIASQDKGHRDLRVDVGSARPWEEEQWRKKRSQRKNLLSSDQDPDHDAEPGGDTSQAMGNSRVLRKKNCYLEAFEHVLISLTDSAIINLIVCQAYGCRLSHQGQDKCT